MSARKPRRVRAAGSKVTRLGRTVWEMPNGGPAMYEAMMTWSRMPWPWIKKAGERCWSLQAARDLDRAYGTKRGPKVFALLALSEGLTKPGDRELPKEKALKTVGVNVGCYAIAIARRPNDPRLGKHPLDKAIDRELAKYYDPLPPESDWSERAGGGPAKGE